MESDQKRAALYKLASKACDWLDSRNVKAALTGAAKEVAKSKQRANENALAEAVEKYRKEN